MAERGTDCMMPFSVTTLTEIFFILEKCKKSEIQSFYHFVPILLHNLLGFGRISVNSNPTELRKSCFCLIFSSVLRLQISASDLRGSADAKKQTSVLAESTLAAMTVNMAAGAAGRVLTDQPLLQGGNNGIQSSRQNSPP